MTCDPNELSQLAQCFRCIPPGRARQVAIYLLCQWARVGEHTPEVREWVDTIIENGGDVPPPETQDILDDFIDDLVTAGVRSHMVTVNCFVPNSFMACLTPIIHTAGFSPYHSVGFTGGELSVNGLKGGLGNAFEFKYLKTGVQPFNTMAHNSAGITIYRSFFTPEPVNEDTYHDSVMSDGTTYLFGIWTCFSNAFTSLGNIWSGSPGGGVTYNNPLRFYGYASINRTADNVLKLYLAGRQGANPLPHTMVAQNNVVEANPFRVFLEGMPIFAHWDEQFAPDYKNCSSKQFSFYALHAGLTEAQSNSFYNAVQAMRVRFGGGYV